MAILYDVRKIQWIMKTKICIDIINEREEKDKYKPVYFLKNFVVPDILTDEPILQVFKSIKFFDGLPLNFWDYIRKVDISELDLLYESEYEEYYLNIIDLLKEVNKLHEDEICNFAAKINLVLLLEYAKTKKLKWDQNTTKIAYENSSKECLKFLFENGCLLHDDIFKND